MITMHSSKSYEVDGDLETLKRMAELKKSPDRLAAAEEALAEQGKIISSMADLKERRDKIAQGEMTDLGNGENRHRHEVDLDNKGNGNTTTTLGSGPDHRHDVVDSQVQPGGEDQHTHKYLTEDRRGK
jgi:hypothetical protein